MEDVFPYRVLRCGSIVASSPRETEANEVNKSLRPATAFVIRFK